MKKLLLILMAIILTVSLVACMANNQNSTGDNQTIGDDQTGDNSIEPENNNTEGDVSDNTATQDLRATFDSVIAGITPEELALDTVEVNNDLFPGVFFVDAPAQAYEAYVSMPLIGSIAHQVALVRVSDGTDVAALAADMEANLDPRKWVCVEAEKTAVLTKDNMILVVMSTADVVDAATANFEAL